MAGGAPSVVGMSRVAQRGQAAVEGVGIVVVVAVLVAAVAMWLVREVRPPDEPPDVIAAVARPLQRDPLFHEGHYPLPPPVFEVPFNRDQEPIGRALKVLARGTGEGIVLVAEMRMAFELGFYRRLKERGEALLRDPLGQLPDAQSLVTGGVRDELARAAGLWEYAQQLRSMPLRDAALRVSGDAGALGADIAIRMAVKAGRTKLERIGRDRASRAP